MGVGGGGPDLKRARQFASILFVLEVDMLIVSSSKILSQF